MGSQVAPDFQSTIKNQQLTIPQATPAEFARISATTTPMPTTTTVTTTEAILVPPNTIASAKGDGLAVEVTAAANRVFLVTLAIARIIEQESLDVSIYGSADGATWDAKSIAAFPQKFYTGESPLLLDLTAHPHVKLVRAHWEVARWGRGTETPLFEFGVTLREVPANILKEATAEAKARA